jgi:hypothetical protein
VFFLCLDGAGTVFRAPCGCAGVQESIGGPRIEIPIDIRSGGAKNYVS